MAEAVEKPPEDVGGGRPLESASAESVDGSGVAKLLVVSLNEGLKDLGLELAQRALAEAFSGQESGVRAVAIARQETISDGSWDAALASFGFNHKAVAVGTQNVLAVYSRDPGDCSSLDSFVTLSPNIEKKKVHHKGCATAALRCMGLTMCIGGAHLDGNFHPPGDRVAQLPLAVLRSVAHIGAVDVAIFAGDINCAIDPEKASGAAGSDGCAKLLATEITNFRASAGEKGQVELSHEAKEALQHSLIRAASRDALMQCVDGCPRSIAVSADSVAVLNKYKTDVDADVFVPFAAGEEEIAASASCGIVQLQLQPMPPGSFPTYRLSNVEGRAVAALSPATGDEQTDMQHLRPTLDVSTEAVQELFFADPKAGVLKKRGDMIRLNLGWLDRLYCGVRQDSGEAVADVRIEQGCPLMLQASDGTMMDHAFMSWMLTIQPRVPVTGS